MTERTTGRAPAPKRIAFAALLTIVGLNVWMGGPLFALWVGSRVQGSGPPTMAAVFVVVVVLAAVCFVLAVLFGRLTRRYQELTGQTATVRQHTPWLRSMRGERPQYAGVEPTLTAPERILVGMVVVAFVLFEVWFFFFSGSPIDNRTGRSALEPPTAAQSRLASSGGCSRAACLKSQAEAMKSATKNAFNPTSSKPDVAGSSCRPVISAITATSA